MTYQSAVLAGGPIGYYRLGESSGTTMADSSGNGRDGIYSLGGGSLLGEPGLLTGDADTSVKFISNDDIATVDVAANPEFKSTLVSCSARVMIGSFTGNQTIAGRWNGSIADSAWVFRRESSGQLACYIFIGGSYRVATGATALAVDTEYSVGFTWDGATIRLFLDGDPDGSATGAAVTMNTGTADFTIGRRAAAATEGLFGWADEVAVYDYRVPDASFAIYHDEALSPTTDSVSGTLDVTAPAAVVDLSDATRGALTVTAPLASATTVGAAAASGPLAASAPLATVSLVGSVPDTITGILGSTAPAAIASLAGLLDDTIRTDMANDYNGRERHGRALVETEDVVEPLPVNLTRAMRQDKAIAYPTPTLVDGRPT